MLGSFSLSSSPLGKPKGKGPRKDWVHPLAGASDTDAQDHLKQPHNRLIIE